MTTPYSEGSPSAKICFIGEAPANYEMLHQKPLVGPTGKIFDELLHQADIYRATSSIQNVCRRPISKKHGLTDSKNRLTEKGLAVQRDLFTRMENHSANVYVPMGNLALAMLSDYSGITKYRGSAYIGHEGRKLLPTIHPAATIHGKYIDKYTIASDLKTAKAESSHSDLTLMPRTMEINPSFPTVVKYLTALNEEDATFACDIECLWHQVSCLSFSRSPEHALCIPFFGTPHPWSESEEAEIWRLIARIFDNPACTAVFHNAMFDVSFLYLQNMMRFNCTVHCTLIMHRILYPDFPASLQFVTSVYTDMQYYKDERKIWSKPWVDPDTFYRYNCKDSLATITAFPQLHAEIQKSPGMRWTYNETMSNFWPCLYMMAHGIQLDLDNLGRMKVKIDAELKAKTEELNRASDNGHEFLYTSPKQVMEYFYGHKGCHPYVNRKTGQPTSDDEAMARIHRKYNLPEARLVQECRALRKLFGTYLDITFDQDRRLRCFYDPRGTSTGRLSSSKTIFETGLNFQNIDPRFKEFIVCDNIQGA